MRALIRGKDGDVLFDDVPEPVPGPGELLVEVDAFSINRGETMLLGLDREDWRPGKDVAGTVIRAATDGTGLAEGTRVVAHPPANGWAERVAVPTGSVAELPASVDSVTAAALPLAGITALGLLRAAGSLAGTRVLITGASGGVGHYFTELAAAQGARVTAVSTRGKRLLELGAEAVADTVDDVGGKFDVVLESVGGSAFSGALQALAGHGTLIWFGQASKEPISLNFFHFDTWPVDATIKRYTYEPPQRPFGEDLATLVRLVHNGSLHPEIGVETDWADTAQVIDDLRGRRITGNAVLTVRPLSRVLDARSVVARYVRALQEGDLATATASLHPDAVWHIPGNGRLAGDYVGPDAIFGDFYAKAVARFDPATPSTLTLRSIVADGPIAIAQWRTTGRTLTGADYDNSYAVAFEVRDGKIAEVWEYLDTAHFETALFG